MNRLQLIIPPPFYLLTFAGLMWLLSSTVPIMEVIAPPWNLAGLGLIALAFIMDFWSLGLFFRAHTTFNPMHPERTQSLVTTGTYRYTRNPMYVGMLVILLGWCMYLGSLSAFALLPVFVWVLTRQQIIPEEQALTQHFGQTYRDYQQRVPRWLW